MNTHPGSLSCNSHQVRLPPSAGQALEGGDGFLKQYVRYFLQLKPLT